MTEDQIERRVEKMIDHLDRQLMAGALSEKDYTTNMADLRRWEDAQLHVVDVERRAALRPLLA
jgi:hypothetical protein